MIISLLRIKPPPAKRREALELLHYILEPTRVNPECLGCCVYETDSDESILYVEKWQGNQALYEHIQSGSYMSVLAAMELSTVAPEVAVVDDHELDGLELIKSLRSV